MWPPSRGRKGKRLIRPSERLTTARRSSDFAGADIELLVGHGADPDDAGDFLAPFLFEEPGEDGDGAAETSHIRAPLRSTASLAPKLAVSLP